MSNSKEYSVLLAPVTTKISSYTWNEREKADAEIAKLEEFKKKYPNWDSITADALWEVYNMGSGTLSWAGQQSESKRINSTNAKQKHALKWRQEFRSMKTYLDYGCGDGYAGNWVLLNYNSRCKLFSCDLVDGRKKIIPGSKFITPDKVEGFSDGFFDLTTCFHVLHHIEALEEVISTLCRVSKKIIIKEHDIGIEGVEKKVDDVHIAYEVCEQAPGMTRAEFDKWLTTRKLNLVTKEKMISMFEKGGMKCESVDVGGPEGIYFMICRK